MASRRPDVPSRPAAEAAAPVPGPGLEADGRLPLPWIGPALAAGLALKRSHAVLIHGPAEAGQWAVAGVLAQSALCEAPLPSGLACGRCDSCHLVRQRLHPDLRVLMPEADMARLGWVWTTGEEGEGGGESRKKPSSEIKVQQIREAIAWSQHSSARGRGKLVLLHRVERMNAVSANALLKTLEEPPGLLRLLLTCEDPEQLLPTVRSRCQRLPLGWPDGGEAGRWLVESGLAAADAQALLAFAGGSPLAALTWGGEGVDAAWLASLPARLARGDGSMLAGWPVPRALVVLSRVAHDAAARAVGGRPRFLPQADWPEPGALAPVLAWQGELQRVARHADHPWNAPVLLEALAQGARSIGAPQPPRDRGPAAAGQRGAGGSGGPSADAGRWGRSYTPRP